MRYRAQDIIMTIGTAIAHITQGTLDRTAALIETTGGGDTGRNREPGYKDFTLGGTARFKGDVLTVGSEVVCSMSTGAVSVEIFTGTAIINQFQVGGGHEDAVDITYQVTRSKD